MHAGLLIDFWENYLLSVTSNKTGIKSVALKNSFVKKKIVKLSFSQLEAVASLSFFA